ncbi:MAG TPA: hypothetical protein DEG96_07605 [Candidatus Atribacteria bacterium]|nr:hypothetical protein [Candidatus Atribacteria bacterium]
MDTKSFFEKLKLFIKQSENIARWREWNTSKLPLIFLVFYYLIAINKDFSYTSLLSFLNFVAFVCLYASFGYMINDFSDREVDKKAGKPKAIAQISPRVAKLVLFSIFLLGVLISLPFWLHNTDFLILLIAMYLISTFYSLPPVRFKERYWMGIIVASITQRVFPALLCFVIYNYFGWDSLLFLLLFFIIGIRWIIVHQIKDYKNDLKANVKTFITSIGILKGTRYLLKYVIPLEIVFLAIILIYAIIKIPLMGFFVGVCLLITYLLGLRTTKEWLLNSVLVEESFLSSFYFFYLPLSLTIIISFFSPKFLILAVFQLMWSKNIIEGEIKLLKRPKVIFEGQERQTKNANKDITERLWHHIDNIFYFEWWYFDAIFDDDSSLAGSLSINGYHSLPETIKAIADFTLNINYRGKIEVQKNFSHKEILLLEDMIIIGKNKIERSQSNSILHLEKDNCKLTLNFKKMLSGFSWGRNGRVIFTRGGDRYLAWLTPLPRAEVSGILKTSKGTFNLKGLGYNDHTWGTISLKDNISHWHWGRMHLEELTLIFAEIVFKNKTRIISLAIGEREKLVYTNSKISKVSLVIPTQYEGQKPKIPSSFKLIYQDRKIYLNLDLNMEKILKEKLRPRKLSFFSKPYYARFISTIEGRIVLDGKELINGHIGRTLHEHSVF